VTPSVNAGNLISMQINQSISDVGSIDSATGQRSFLQRMIASKVAVRSGETIVLGGLIRDNKGDGKQGIPWLQDIPVIGALFSTTTLSKTRTELLVMITAGGAYRAGCSRGGLGVEVQDAGAQAFAGYQALKVPEICFPGAHRLFQKVK
jgi:hypothetical protein